MPKAVPTTSHGQPAPTLARNQACHTCRKRKQKCDAQRPFCGGCIRSWKARGQVVTPDGAGGNPACTYDDPWDFIPGHAAQDAQTIDGLKARIGELEKGGSEEGEGSAPPGGQQFMNNPSDLFDPPQSQSAFQPDISTHFAFDPTLGLFPTPNLTPPVGNSTSSSTSTASPNASAHAAAANNALFFTSWPPNLPGPDMLHHLVDVFFSHFPLAPRILHQSTFMNSLTLPPSNPLFPPASLLHAICAYASMFSPAVPNPQIHDSRPPPQPNDELNASPPPPPPDKPHLQPGQAASRVGVSKRPESFADFQARMAKNAVDESTAVGLHLVENFQALTILGWFWFAQARWVELWMWSGIALRHSVPLGLNVSDEIPTTLNRSGKTALIPSPPDTPEGRIEKEMRRNTFWAAYLLERYACASSTWANSLDELDITTELPVSLADFDAGNIPPAPRQRLSCPDVLTSHPAGTTDSYGMHIKACHLMARIHLHNLRFRASPQGRQCEGEDPREAPQFKMLDGLVVAFCYSLPGWSRDPFRADAGCMFDPHLYMVSVVPHLATIHLHDPHIDASNPADPSAERLLGAARAILQTVYVLCSTSFDISLLVHSCCQAWWLASRVLVRFLKAKIDARDRDTAVALRGEIQVFQLALSRIGEKVPLGQRFGKMLGELLEAEMAQAEEKINTYCTTASAFERGEEAPLNQPDLFNSVVGMEHHEGPATLVELDSPPLGQQKQQQQQSLQPMQQEGLPQQQHKDLPFIFTDPYHTLTHGHPQHDIPHQLPPEALSMLAGGMTGLSPLSAFPMDALGMGFGMNGLGGADMGLQGMGMDLDFGQLGNGVGAAAGSSMV